MQLSKAIVQEAVDDDVWVLLNNQLPESIASIRNELSNSLPQNKIIVFESIGRTNELTSPSLFRTQSAELCRESFIAGLRPDFVFVTSLFEGLGDEVVTSVGQFPPAHNTAVTLYDLIPLVQKQKYLTDDIREAHYMRKFSQLTRADVLLAISEFSRDEGRQLLDYPKNRIINMSSAIGDYFRPVNVPLTEKESLLGKLGVSNRFLLYTGSFDQRKNHKNLIKAFALIPSVLRSELQLVMVGNGWDGVYSELQKFAQSCGLSDRDVIFAGHISDDDLLKLYNLCHLFVFPSLFEGFGLPILEAMACGKPAIGSNSTSIPEVIGRADALFDPASPTSIAAKITEVLKTPTFYRSLSEHALAHSKKFSWQRSARVALDAFREFASPQAFALNDKSAVGGRRGEAPLTRARLIERIAALPGADAAKDDQIELAAAIAINERLTEIISGTETAPKNLDPRERLGVVSTWGTRCGVAAYCKLLLGGLPLDVSVFAPYSDLLIAPDESFVSRCWTPGDLDDLIKLEEQIIKSGVTAVLIQFHYGFYHFDALARLVKVLGVAQISTSIQLHSTADPPEHILPKKLKTLADTLRACANVFVLSAVDIERLSNIGVSENVTLMPLAVNCAAPKSVPYERSKGEFVIASYGFFLPHKGIHELIRAAASLAEAVPSIRLLLVNAEYPIPLSRALIEEAKTLVNELGLAKKAVIVSEYLSDEESIGYLSKADLIVFPYQQTTEPASAAVRLGIASGVPVAVTPIDIFKDVGDIVHRLPGMDVNSIANGLRELRAVILAKKPTIEHVKQNAKQWRGSHDYANLSRYLYSRIAIACATQKGYRVRLQFASSDTTLRTIVGQRDRLGISAYRKAGVLVFGPYIRLPAGTYQLSISGSCDAKNTWDAFELRLLHAGGVSQVPFDHVAVAAGELLGKVEFRLAHAVANFEMQICSNDRHFVAITELLLVSDRRIQ